MAEKLVMLMSSGGVGAVPDGQIICDIMERYAAKTGRKSGNAKNTYEPQVMTLPKILDEEVARLHLARLGVELETLSTEQADYIGVPVTGPYKPNHYRY